MHISELCQICWPHQIVSHDIPPPLPLPFQVKRLQHRLAHVQRVIDYDNQELEFTKTDEDLKELIVYCRSVTIKPWNWNLQRETSVSEMFSFGEPTAVGLCKDFKQGWRVACGYRILKSMIACKTKCKPQ